MNLPQRFIKYIAIFLAVCLIIVFATSALHIIVGIADAVIPSSKHTIVEQYKDKNEDKSEESELIKSEEVFEEVENLNIASGLYKIRILEDSSIKEGIKICLSNISSDCEVTYSEATKTVEIDEDENFFNFLGEKKSRLKGSIDVYVAEKNDMNEVNVEIGVGNVSIKDIKTKRLDIECGVGTFSCDDVEAESVRIRGGVGNVDCDDIKCEDFSVEGGVGDINIKGELVGKIEISAGMGDIDVKIDGKKEEYSWSIETGLGSIFIDGEKYGDTDFNNNSQDNLIDIEGGIGSVEVDFN